MVKSLDQIPYDELPSMVTIVLNIENSIRFVRILFIVGGFDLLCTELAEMHKQGK